jgi:hypothetical protein
VLKLATQLGEHPTVIGELVGLALVALVTPCVEEMIQQPGCPNLYWALASLPSPLIPLHTGMQGERLIYQKHFRLLAQAAVTSEADLAKALREFEKLYEGGGKAVEELREKLGKLSGDDAHVEAARKRLSDAGVEGAAKLKARQVVVLDEIRRFEERHDAILRWLAQPYHKGAPRLEAETKRAGGLFSDLTPAPLKVYRSQARNEQRLRMLQILEALRLHAAENGGALPKSLADVDVPLPDDPVTGKPFRYELKDGTATLRGTPVEKTAAANVVYHLKIVK